MQLKKLLFTILPKNLISHLTGILVHWNLPQPLANWSKSWFIRRYKLRMNEAELPLENYRSIGEVFTRKLKPGLRPIGSGFVHPADGALSQFGDLFDGQMLQAKNKMYSVGYFLGDAEKAQGYKDGKFLTYYLCPTDYHRVHSPEAGQIISCVHIPGRLWPVNPWSVENVSQVFAVNERVVIYLKTVRGVIAIVMVGATNVGKMTMSFDSEIVSNASHWRNRTEKIYTQPIAIAKGQELGIFNMGSTVIVVTPKNYFDNFKPTLGAVIMGQSL